MTRAPQRPSGRKRRNRGQPAKKAKGPARKQAKTPRHDPLDDFIASGAKALGLSVEKAWLPAVRANLEVTLRLGGLVADFTLPDDAEPAPVFGA